MVWLETLWYANLRFLEFFLVWETSQKNDVNNNRTEKKKNNLSSLCSTLRKYSLRHGLDWMGTHTSFSQEHLSRINSFFLKTGGSNPDRGK